MYEGKAQLTCIVMVSAVLPTTRMSHWSLSLVNSSSSPWTLRIPCVCFIMLGFGPDSRVIRIDQSILSRKKGERERERELGSYRSKSRSTTEMEGRAHPS